MFKIFLDCLNIASDSITRQAIKLVIKNKRMRINHITPKNYNVITTYCHDYYYRLDWQPGIPDNGKVLPNAPMAARHTLLAEKLRNGSYVTGYREKSKIDSAPRGPSPKNHSKFLGKLIGVEIEYYPKRGDAIQRNLLTAVVGDGSLDCGGAEIRRLTWASVSGRLEGLLKLKLVGTINKLCGLHVHIDARHLGTDGTLDVIATYKRLITLYPMLKNLVPKSRRRNRYCRWTDNSMSLDRYCAINFASFAQHGTLEFRCQGGSVNLIKIESWALLCQYLVNFAANPANTMPSNWGNFVAILPEPLRSWCILRKEKLYGNAPLMNERTMSATTD